MVSVAPPAGNGTTSLMGLAGKVYARAASRAASVTAARTIDRSAVMRDLHCPPAYHQPRLQISAPAFTVWTLTARLGLGLKSADSRAAQGIRLVPLAESAVVS